jgi:hypothetical protein
MSSSIDLSAWVEKIKAARNRTELFAMLDEFRILEWTDEQRASIAKLYMRLLSVLPQEEAADAQSASDKKSNAAHQAEEDEEVWYEKM